MGTKERTNLLNLAGHAPKLLHDPTGYDGYFLVWSDTYMAFDLFPGGTMGVVDATYILMATVAELPKARLLTSGIGLTMTDGGAGAGVTFGMTMAGATRGAVLYRDAANWAALAPATTSGVFMVCAGTTPSWAAPSVFTMDEFGPPEASVDMNEQQAVGFVLEHRTDSPTLASIGRMWLRSDLA